MELGPERMVQYMSKIAADRWRSRSVNEGLFPVTFCSFYSLKSNRDYIKGEAIRYWIKLNIYSSGKE